MLKRSHGRTRILLLAAVCLALSCALGCAPQVSDAPVEDEGGGVEGVAFTWSSDSDCATCHVDQSDAGVGCVSLHVERGLSCLSCHADEVGLQAAHEGVSLGDAAAKRLKETEVPDSLCMASGCHDDEAARVEATASLTLLTDVEGTTVNPHSLPQVEEHESVTCSECHAGHDEMDAQGVCASCHHAGVYQCGTCH